MPFKYKWLAFIVVLLWSLELIIYQRIKLEMLFLAIGYSLGVFVPSLFSWARPLRLYNGLGFRNLKIMLIVIGIVGVLIFVLDPLARMLLSPRIYVIEQSIENLIFGGFWAYIITSSDDNDEHDFLKGTSSKIQELVQRVREVHGPSAVPLSAG